MRFPKISLSIRQLSTHILAIFMGVMLTVTSLRVLPSVAEPGPNPVTESLTKVAQKPSSAAAAIGSHSFVTTAVNRVGSAVVRIDTERTI
ncbi:MAG: serine protease, partial [Dolichospermum sp.]